MSAFRPSVRRHQLTATTLRSPTSPAARSSLAHSCSSLDAKRAVGHWRGRRRSGVGTPSTFLHSHLQDLCKSYGEFLVNSSLPNTLGRRLQSRFILSKCTERQISSMNFRSFASRPFVIILRIFGRGLGARPYRISYFHYKTPGFAPAFRRAV